jgi:hypothetical protein
MGFADSIRASNILILKETQAKCYTIMNELFTEVVDETPVGATSMEEHPGLLKSNWFSSVGDTPSPDTTSSYDTAGSNSLLNILNLMEADLFDGKDDIATLTNNISYGMLAEELGWMKPQWSGSVGPYAMVKNSLMKISVKYKGE